MPTASTLAGRGLRLRGDARRGDVLERAVTNELTEAECAVVDSIPGVGDFYFRHPKGPGGLLVLGPASLCNHAEIPTAELRFVHDPDLGIVAELVAGMDLPDGVELTLRYRCALWFEPRG
jgi:hypothetical protein